MDDKHLVAVIDFGSQYTQLIVRRVRELGYMAKLYALEDLDQIHEPGAVILSGGPKSTTDADAPDIDFEWLQSLNVPGLGVCYGMQLLNIKHGGTVKASNKREYGPAALLPEACTGLYRDMSPSSQVWMSHSDTGPPGGRLPGDRPQRGRRPRLPPVGRSNFRHPVPSGSDPFP